METKAKRLIIKTEEPTFAGTRELPCVVLKAFPDGGYEGFRPLYDKLLENATIVEKDGVAIIEGVECNMMTNLGRSNYSAKRFICEVYGDYRVKRDPEYAASALNKWIASWRKQFGEHLPDIKIKTEDIKIGYESKWYKFIGRKQYYVDNTPELIETLDFVDHNYVEKDEKGFYVDRWYISRMSPPKLFKMQTNNYRLTIF